MIRKYVFSKNCYFFHLKINIIANWVCRILWYDYMLMTWLLIIYFGFEMTELIFFIGLFIIFWVESRLLNKLRFLSLLINLFIVQTFLKASLSFSFFLIKFFTGPEMTWLNQALYLVTLCIKAFEINKFIWGDIIIYLHAKLLNVF